MMRVRPCDEPYSCTRSKRSTPSTRRPRRARWNRVALPIPPRPSTMASYAGTGPPRGGSHHSRTVAVTAQGLDTRPRAPISAVILPDSTPRSVKASRSPEGGRMPTLAPRNAPLALGALACLSILAPGRVLAQSGSDGEWTMPAKDYSSTRFSKLAEITPANAARLRPVWTFSTGVLAGHQGQPLVVKNTMYVVTPWPNVLYAFDLTQEGYPLKWKYRPDVSPNAIGESCCDVINRGAFYADGKVIYNLLDGHTVAVNAET